MSSNTPRGLLTAREKDAARGAEDMNQNLRSAHLARVKRKIPKLSDDVELLREYRPEIYEMAIEAICPDESEERIDELEARLERIEDNIDVTGD